MKYHQINSITLFLLLLFLLMNSCGHAKRKQYNGVKDELSIDGNSLWEIDPRKFNDSELLLSEIAADIEYIPLSNEIYLGYIGSIKITESGIYLISQSTDGADNSSVLIKYTNQGKDPIQIGSVGKGPGEYLSSSFFAVDEKNDRIYINGNIKTIMVFTTNGQYINKFPYPVDVGNFNRMDIFGNGNLFIAETNLGAQAQYNWIIIDSTGNLLSFKRNSTMPFETNLGPRAGINKFNNQITYFVDYNDTIFCISQDSSFRPYGIFIRGPHSIPKQVWPFSLDLIEEMSEFYSPISFLETRNFMIHKYIYQKKHRYVFFRKSDRESFICNYENNVDIMLGGITNNIDGGIGLCPTGYFTSGGDEYLVTYFHAFQLKEYVTSEAFQSTIPKYPEKKKELITLANSLDENDNPVLIVVRLKK